MIPEQLPDFHYSHLENKAEKFLCEKLGENYAIPIDVELLIESVDGVDFDYWPGLKPNYEILGAVFRIAGTDQLLIIIDEALADADHQRNRYRMTVAEELAHVLLHQDVIAAVESIDDFRKLQQHSDWSRAERQAKRFVAAVLMPGSRVQSEAENLYPQLVKTAGFGNREVVKKYLRNLLADRFEVSPESMGYRLKEKPMDIDGKVDAAMELRLDSLSELPG